MTPDLWDLWIGKPSETCRHCHQPIEPRRRRHVGDNTIDWVHVEYERRGPGKQLYRVREDARCALFATPS